MRAEALTELRSESELPPAPVPTGKRRRGETRVEVAAITRARTPKGERAIRIAGLSSRTALLLSVEPLGVVGQCIDVDVPIVGGTDLAVMAGLTKCERYREGHATTVEFVIVDHQVRCKLKELLALFLSGESDIRDQQRPVVYDAIVAYGPTGLQRAFLQEISLTGLSMRIAGQMARFAAVDVSVPTLRGGALALPGRVTGQRLSAEGGYITTIDFEPLDGPRRGSLGELVADLMCR